MDCQPNRAAVLDYGARWGIELMFSDFKTRGFQLEDTQLEYPDQVDRLILMMALAMYCASWLGKRTRKFIQLPLKKSSPIDWPGPSHLQKTLS